MSVWKAGALAIAELGVTAFFLAGVVGPVLGSAAPWWILATCTIAAAVRAIDMESWALLLPGDLTGRVERAYGERAAAVAAAATLTERFLLAALALTVAAHYATTAIATGLALRPRAASLKPEELSAALAVLMLGGVWIRVRLGLDLPRQALARGIWIGIAVLVATTAWAAFSLAHTTFRLAVLIPVAPPGATAGRVAHMLLAYGLALGLVLPALGGGDGLAREAHDFEPPRLRGVKRTALLAAAFAFVAVALPAFAFSALVPGGDQIRWSDVPLEGLTHYLVGPAWLKALMVLAIVVAAFVMLAPAAYAALVDAERLLRRLSAARVLSEGLAVLHPRFGTPARAIDVAVAATAVVLLTGSGRVAWLSSAYAVAVAMTLLLKIAALVRLRRAGAGPSPFRTPLTLRIRGRELPIGLLGPGLVAAVAGFSMLMTGNGPAIAAVSMTVALALFFTIGQRASNAREIEAVDTVELLTPSDLSLGHVDARPGNVLVPVRNPHALAHVADALRDADDRDVVVMTVRLSSGTVETLDSMQPLEAERELFSAVATLAERYGRPLRLMIVPAHNVFDAIVATTLELRSAEIHCGESASLSAAEQARLLGDAWERAARTEGLSVSLVIHRHSGRTDTYHLGAHAPALSPRDLDLIHRVWLDAVKAIGPHVHHHDVVRAALTQMEEQLKSPNRDEAIDAIREVARPADELAAVLRSRDYSRLRDMVRNRHAGDVAELLTALKVEDQVVVFRVLPRKDAAAVFEYLSQDAKETLLKALAQEDVAALLNDMAPDDRTMFLEELPAAATRQLLSLLTPEERSVALTLLGYPERSVGRLMTPNYVAVREDWTVADVLNYVRTHGQDSETLNVIYVVNEDGLLIDDIRIREFLLAPLDRRVGDLMDRRFVALTATDDQETAVALFRQYDRSALPVTDTAGVLIGIVTIDDVLDVAEAAATREIQRTGGSEALDEPYTEIAFGRMIQKRAGWLTALFLGEMLTASAMGVFEAEISRAVVLALFVPLIISSGGNSGSQASTLVIRALALGEVGLADWWRVMRREVLAGLSLGAILGSIGFLRIMLWSTFSHMYDPYPFLVALTVAISLVGIVLWGTLIGSLLPFLLRRLGFDPATSSAPFVATLVDVTGLVIYFSVATVVLRGTLL